MKLFEIKRQTPQWLFTKGDTQDASYLAEAAGKNTHLE
jgi:hypothetical protein